MKNKIKDDIIFYYDSVDNTYNIFNTSHYRRLLDYFILNKILFNYDYDCKDILNKKILFNDYRDKECSRYIHKVEKRWYMGYYLILITSQEKDRMVNEKCFIWKNINSKDDIIINESFRNHTMNFVF
jgi:hypothetical protein